MARTKDPNSVCSFIESQMEANPDVTVHELIMILRKAGIQADRRYIHTIRNKYWTKHPDRRPEKRRLDSPNHYSSTIHGRGRIKMQKFCICCGAGVSYSFFGSLDEANQNFVIEELTQMQDSITLSEWLRSLITDVRLDKEELEETKKRVKSWQTES